MFFIVFFVVLSLLFNLLEKIIVIVNFFNVFCNHNLTYIQFFGGFCSVMLLLFSLLTMYGSVWLSFCMVWIYINIVQNLINI